ncbi:MAG: potassium transporter TrkA [Bacteroidetes bacterium]|jgi:K+/H+ antiporter YhaU regulatory subunit KhtT/preprotein translocase subunit SecG|nr:potassium transporter TrkA [Bacteroidota bacterium]MBK7038964.1 potassium transporter TrkA [Bacteroidota bacterium]MBK8329450.1 potassium transporter TrkA [Bacteroidota bacterium]
MNNNHPSKVSFREKFQYYFENTMSAGPMNLIKWLALFSLFSVMILGVVIVIFGISSSPESNDGLGFVEGAWQSLMATLDSGTMGGDEGWAFRMVRFAATLIGIFLISILIGAISSAIDEKLDELKQGRSKVQEKNHTLILGWSEKIFSIISELVLANENQKRSCIVVLSEKNKTEAEEEIRSKVSDFKRTKIVVRHGSPLDATDIAIVNPNEAKSILVLSPDQDNADIHVIKTVLGLTRSKKRKEGFLNIIAEIKNENNMEAADLVGNNEALFIRSDDIISRITAQTCLQSGLSVVYSELLRFEGDEIYFKEEPSMVGKTYKEMLFQYEDSTVIGVITSKEEALINPPMHYVIQSGDQVIAISEDDDTIILNGKAGYDASAKNVGKAMTETSKLTHSLVLGWNDNGAKIIQELDNYVSKGSGLKIVADLSDDDIANIETMHGQISNMELTYMKGEISDKKTLESLNVGNYSNIIVLSYKYLEVQESDAKTLICLLHLRNICEQFDKNFNIVTEMLDLKNRELGVVAKADDFIVGDNLISLLLSQLSENRTLKKVYDELFKSEGSEIYLKPASRYIQTGLEVDFYNIVANAAALNETAIGYRYTAMSDDMDQNFGVKINPNKTSKVTFSADDFVIVLSED